jgi:hypothetical protein
MSAAHRPEFAVERAALPGAEPLVFRVKLSFDNPNDPRLHLPVAGRVGPAEARLPRETTPQNFIPSVGQPAKEIHELLRGGGMSTVHGGDSDVDR